MSDPNGVMLICPSVDILKINPFWLDIYIRRYKEYLGFIPVSLKTLYSACDIFCLAYDAIRSQITFPNSVICKSRYAPSIVRVRTSKAELLFRCDYFPPRSIPIPIIISTEILCAGYGMNLGNLYHYEIL